MWLQDTGLLKKLRDDELKAPEPIPLPNVKRNQSLSISQLATAFILLASGIVASIPVFIVEFLNEEKVGDKDIMHRQVGWGPPTRRQHEREVWKGTTIESVEDQIETFQL